MSDAIWASLPIRRGIMLAPLRSHVLLTQYVEGSAYLRDVLNTKAV